MIVLILFIIICVLLTSMTVYNYLYTKKIETEDVPESSSLSMLVDTCALDKEILEDCKRQKVDRLYDEISKLAKECCKDPGAIRAFETLYYTYYYALQASRKKDIKRIAKVVSDGVEHRRRISLYKKPGIYSFISRFIISMFVIYNKSPKAHKNDVFILPETCGSDIV